MTDGSHRAEDRPPDDDGAITSPESTNGAPGDNHPDNSRRNREQRLVEDKEWFEDLIAAISHDLRTPLTVAEGNAQLARETGDLSRLDATQRALDRATDLLDHLETVVKNGLQITEPEPVDLREGIEAAWELVGTEDATLSIEETWELAADR